MSAIVEFLEGRGPDGAGRRVDEVLAFGLGALESQHDFIQWLFPLSEPSQVVSGSPVHGPADVQAIKASPAAQISLAAAQRRMSWFYDWTDQWLQTTDHNHLRITRIIKRLRLLVGDAEANKFRARILAKANRHKAPISNATQEYWAKA